MQSTRVFTSICLLLCLSVSANFFTHCGAKRPIRFTAESKQPKKLRASKHTLLEQMMTQLNLAQQLESSTSNTQPYGVSSPFTLPPYDSLPPVSIPENAPPFCVYPPNTPQTPTANSPPSSSYPELSPPPGPVGSGPNPPEFSYPNPPAIIPNPPQTVPSPSGPTLNPGPPGPDMGPPYYEPGPPTYIPSPSAGLPSPTGSIPGPSGFLPPIVFPPPMVPPPPSVTPKTAFWCVAKPSVPDPIIQEAMNYACGSGADCNAIQPNGPCFKPNTLWAHASFAFNSYWQRTKGSGGSCSFGSTAMLVTVDPSYDGCRFEYF